MHRQVRSLGGRGRIWTAIVATVAIATMAGCGGGGNGSANGGEPSKIVIGTQAQDVQPEALIKPMGWFEKHVKAPVSYANFDGGGAMNTAIRSGKIDIAELGTPPFALGLDQGLDYKAIFVDNIPAQLAEGLVVRKSLGITNPKQLVGMTIATPFGSGSDYMLGQMLVHYGISQDQVKLLNLSPGAIGSAWKSGKIDAAYIYSPISTSLLSDGGEYFVTDLELLKYSGTSGDVIVVRSEFAKKYPEAVTTFVKAMICATNFADSRSPAALKMLSETFSLPKTEFDKKSFQMATPAEQLGASEYFGGSPPGLVATVKKEANFFKDRGLVGSVADDATVSAAVDGSFLRKAMEQVGGDFSC
jgi:taurine transport system substrate-binding protein